MKQKVAFLRAQSSAAVSAPWVDVESKLASVSEVFAAASEMIDMLCAGVRTPFDQMRYCRQ